MTTTIMALVHASPDKFNSVEEQKFLLTKHEKETGINIDTVVDWSGMKIFDLVTTIKNSGVKKIIIPSYTNLSRNFKRNITLLQILDEIGISVISASDNGTITSKRYIELTYFLPAGLDVDERPEIIHRIVYGVMDTNKNEDDYRIVSGTMLQNQNEAQSKRLQHGRELAKSKRESVKEAFKTDFDRVSGENKCLGKKNGKRAFMYCRSASESIQDEFKPSISSQIDACNKFAVENKLSVTWNHFYGDIASGYKIDDRSGLNQLLHDIKSGDILIVENVDRLSRDSDWQQRFLIDRIEREIGAKIIFCV